MHFTGKHKKVFFVVLFTVIFLFFGLFALQASRDPFSFHVGSLLSEDGIYLYGLTDQSCIGDLRENLIDPDRLSVRKADGGGASESDLISTGCTVTKDGESRIVIVKGDINGDGKILSNDYMLIKNFLAKTIALSDIKQKAADINNDGRISSADYLRIRYHFARKLDIYTPYVPQTSQMADNFTVSKVFDDHMVIQRDEIIRIWGWAPESQNGKYVKAEFQGLTGYGMIADGTWEVTLNGTLSANASSGNNLMISGAQKQLVFKDVLVGDVYFVMGQSNAQWPYYAVFADLPDDSPAREISVRASDPIRLYRTTVDDTSGYPTRGTTILMEDVGHDRGWQLPSQTNVDPFSALGYYYAKQLSTKAPGVPVGVIEIAAGGMALSAFFPNELADEMEIDTLTNGIYTADSAAGNVATRFVYNQYMYPFQRFSTAGIIWYQGESDLQSFNASKYAERFAALMEEYRERFDLLYHPEIPVYVVELPSIYPTPPDYTSDTKPWQFMNFGVVRAEMGVIPTKLSDVYFISSSDIWKDTQYWNNLHPYCKWEQAERLVDLVLAVQENSESLETVCGPIYFTHSVSADGKSVTISFDYTGTGLQSASGTLQGFYVKNGSTWVTPDSVVIVEGNRVVVTSSVTISGVRYNMQAMDSFPESVNLCNSAGMPAVAFSVQW